jgi:hypothetical protein
MHSASNKRAFTREKRKRAEGVRESLLILWIDLNYDDFRFSTAVPAATPDALPVRSSWLIEAGDHRFENPNLPHKLLGLIHFLCLSCV